MKIQSIRLRLTLWYSIAFFISTAVVFTVFYFMNKQTLFYQTDRAITSHAETLARIITNYQPDMVSKVFNQGIIRQQFAEMPGMLVLITDNNGQIIASSQAGADTNETIKELIGKSKNTIKPTFTERRIGTTTLRIGVFPIMQEENIRGFVFMGDPVEAIYYSLNTLFLSLIIAYILFSLPAILGSYFLAKTALRPINNISRELKAITDKNLNTQVKVPSSEELAELAQGFNDLLKRLHDAFHRERQFIGDVAHELKTPIATLQGGIEVALSKNRDVWEYKKTLNEALIDIERLSKTVKNILDLAWTGADSLDLNRSAFDLSEVIREILEIASKLASQKRIVINGNIRSKIFIAGQKEKIFRAVLNIIDNAVKYTHKEGSISFSLYKKKHTAVIEIKDNGIGISQKDIGHIFKRFYRGIKTENTSGSGLGLAIAKNIINAHGGSIKIKSKIGLGTCVVIRMPLYEKISSS